MCSARAKSILTGSFPLLGHAIRLPTRSVSFLTRTQHSPLFTSRLFATTPTPGNGPATKWTQQQLADIWKRAGEAVRKRLESKELRLQISAAKTDPQRWLDYPWGRGGPGLFLDEEDKRPNEIPWENYDANEPSEAWWNEMLPGVTRLMDKYTDPLDMPEYIYLPRAEAYRKMLGDPRIVVTTKHEEHKNCPWRSCNSAWAHEFLCLESRANYGFSLAFAHSRLDLWQDFGFDVWKRDEEGLVVGVRKEPIHRPEVMGFDVSNIDALDELYRRGWEDVYTLVLCIVEGIENGEYEEEGLPPAYMEGYYDPYCE